MRRLRRRLAGEAELALKTLQELTQSQKLPLFLVGGSVRDLILERPGLDFDLVVEGDAVGLARELALAVGARCVVHRQFGTASVRGHGFAFDLATARSERYARPGALPVVRPGSLAQDLARRDFAVNAMALTLSGRPMGKLVDPYDGLGDVARRSIRVLHDSSFVDDATRILRAVRYATRLGFQIEPHTLSLLQRDKGYLATVNSARLRLEFGRILEEEEPEVALGRCQELDVLGAIDPALRFDDELAEAFRRARRAVPVPFLVYLALLALRSSTVEATSLARRLASSKTQGQAMQAVPSVLAMTLRCEAGLRPSQAVRALQPYPEASLWAVALAGHRPQACALVRRYLEEWRHVRPSLDGHALRRLGVPAGPKMGEVMARLKEAWLDGQVRTRDDEVRLVRELVQEMGGEEPLTGRGG